MLEVLSTQPGLQVYTANFLPDGLDGKAGAVYGKHCGICLETQGCPDAPNQPEFPSVVLRPGEKYEQTTEYRFPSVRKRETKRIQVKTWQMFS